MFTYSVTAQKYTSVAFAVDTLDNAETITFTTAERFFDLGVMEYHVEVDSLSGTPAGTISYQYSLDPAGSEWYTVSTDTIADAAATSAQYQVTNFAAYRVRISITGSGTESCEITPFISFKRNR